MPGNAYTGLLRLRRRRRRTWLALVSLLSSFAGLAVSSEYLGQMSERVFVTLAVAIMAVALVTWILHCVSRCPRCGAYYYMKAIGWLPLSCNPFRRSCIGCGLPLFGRSVISESQRDALSLWITNRQSGAPFPDIGLSCPTCGYLLTGLTTGKCPECGCEIVVSQLLG